VLGVAAGDAPVGEDDPRGAQRVRGQPVQAAEDPETAAERQARDPDGRAATARDRQAVRVEGVVDVAEPRPRADRRRAVRDLHRAQRRDVDDDALGRGAPREAVPAAADCHREPGAARERERRGDVLRAGAADDRRRAGVAEARDRRPAERLVARPARPHDLTGDGGLEAAPVGLRERVRHAPMVANRRVRRPRA
jgi:hypothetical protein